MTLSREISWILAIVLVLLGSVSADDESWYRSFLTDRVAPPYLNAHKVLKNRIINPIVSFKTELVEGNRTEDTDDPKVVALVQGLTCASKELYNNLANARGASNELSNALMSKTNQKLAEIRQKENEIQNVNSELHRIEAQVANTIFNIHQAEIDLNNKAVELGRADAQVAEEQRKLEKARLCGIRKKRFVGRAWRRFRNRVVNPIVRPFVPVLRPVLRPICAVLNYQGINTAREHRNAAQGAVNHAREQLHYRRQELQRLQGVNSALQSQKSSISAEIQRLSQNLQQLQDRQRSLVKMIEQMNNVLKHLETFSSKSSVVYEELREFVRPEGLVMSMESMLTTLANNDLSTQRMAEAIRIPPEEINVATDTVGLIKSRLASLTEIENLAKSC